MNRPHAPKPGKQLIFLVFLILVLGVVNYLVQEQYQGVNYLIPLLYYFPVILATYFFELSGGLTAALVSTFLCFPLLIGANNQSSWMGNVLMVEMLSFFMVSFIVQRYMLQQKESALAEKSEVLPPGLIDEEEMEQGLQKIEPIIKADRERLAFCQIVENIYAFHSLEEKLGVILNTIKNDFYCQACSILLLAKENKHLTVKIARGLSGSFIKQAHLEAEDGVWAEVIKNRKEVLLEKDKTETAHVLEKDFHTFLALPLISRQQVLGILHMESAAPHAFSPMDIEIVWDFANLIALLIDNANLLEENRALAVIDRHTGVFNYHYFHLKVEDYIKENERYGKVFSIIVMELTEYYKFKTAHGKERTQEILKEMAAVTKSCLRGVDMVARIGENEFSIVLPETDIKGAQVTAERINKKIGQDLFGALSPNILFCLGLVEFPRDGKTLPALLNQARTRLQETSQRQRSPEPE